MRVRVRIGRLAAALLVGLGWAAAAPAPSAAQAVVLRPGDAVRLELRDEPQLSAVYTVAESGDVLFPLIGTVRVANRPFEEVLEELGTRYGRELKGPDFLATPLMRVTVTGEVQQPGMQFADPSMTVSDVLAVAGGSLPTGRTDRVELTRDGERIELDFDADSPHRSMPVRSGDSLRVPRRSWLSQNLNILVSAAATVAAAALTAVIVAGGNQ